MLARWTNRARAKIWLKKQLNLSKLSPEEKRALIAADTICGVSMGRIKPALSYGLMRFDKPLRAKAVLQDWIGDRLQHVTGCLLSCMFCSAVYRFGNLLVIDPKPLLYEKKSNQLRLDSAHMRDYLTKFFSRDQLYLIETAYEQWRPVDKNAEAQKRYRQAGNYAPEFSKKTERLVAICQNIAERGRFDPAVQFASHGHEKDLCDRLK